MGIRKTISIDGIDVDFKASAALPRMYRLKFRRDIYADFAKLQDNVSKENGEKSGLGIDSLEIFENLASQVESKKSLAQLTAK